MLQLQANYAVIIKIIFYKNNDIWRGAGFVDEERDAGAGSSSLCPWENHSLAIFHT